MTLTWFDTGNIGRSGFVQARLYSTTYPVLELAAIEFHAPTYYANITRHVKGYVEQQHAGPAEFTSMDDAKAWALAIARLS